MNIKSALFLLITAAMAGLSMGGFETKTISINSSDVFSYYGLLSGGAYAPDDIKVKTGMKLASSQKKCN